MNCEQVATQSYTILANTSERGLAFEVGLYLERGFLPCGGVTVARDGTLWNAQRQLHEYEKEVESQ